ncbi:HAD family hydrolase [soil metagenome]
MVRLVATDIDGTLLRSDRTVSPRTRMVIGEVERAGIGFVLVTGRPPRWLAPVRDQIDHRGAAICANGALVIDLESGEVLQSDVFEDEVGLSVIALLRDLAPDLAFGVEWADGFANDARYPRGIRRSESLAGAAHDAASDQDLFARPVVKILARLADRDLEGLIPEAVAAVGEHATVTWSDLGLLEISAAGITKASALQRYVTERGMGSGDVMAFGDMPNDLAMLHWAGHSVAVANAHPNVREAADEVTASNDDDGVAQVLERMLGDG